VGRSDGTGAGELRAQYRSRGDDRGSGRDRHRGVHRVGPCLSRRPGGQCTGDGDGGESVAGEEQVSAEVRKEQIDEPEVDTRRGRER